MNLSPGLEQNLSLLDQSHLGPSRWGNPGIWFRKECGDSGCRAGILPPQNSRIIPKFNLEALMLGTGLAAILPKSKVRDKSIQHHVVAWEGQFSTRERDLKDHLWIIQDGICPLDKESGPPTAFFFFFQKTGIIIIIINTILRIH